MIGNFVIRHRNHSIALGDIKLKDNWYRMKSLPNLSKARQAFITANNDIK